MLEIDNRVQENATLPEPSQSTSYAIYVSLVVNAKRELQLILYDLGTSCNVFYNR